MIAVKRLIRRFLLCIAAFAMIGSANAAFHLFVVEQVYSNFDGSIQFIVLRQEPPAVDEHEWKGHVLQSVHDGIDTIFTFPNDLPNRRTAGRRVLVATQGFASLGIVTPDYVVPNGFLGTGAGLVRCCDGYEYMYPSLPTDGVTALDTLGTPVANVATNFNGDSGSVTQAQAGAGPSSATIVEYYNTALDHYFITWLTSEIAILDAGTQIRGWARTGQTFKTHPTAQGGSTPVCRYYIPPGKGDSHFFGRGTVECTATGQQNPTFVLEDPSFMHMFLPAAGTCPASTTPIYRVFSNRPDANHRYMTDRAIRNQMVARGWLAEGDGPDLVVMCAPQ
jgi:hypothetical protein